MKVEQIYTGCLAQGAYYIECCDEAVVIDPLREVQQYIDRAEAGGKKIKYIFETHFHADFVSGHVTLAEKTGAPIVFGPNAQPKFQAHIAEHGEVFRRRIVQTICAVPCRFACFSKLGTREGFHMEIMSRENVLSVPLEDPVYEPVVVFGVDLVYWLPGASGNVVDLIRVACDGTNWFAVRSFTVSLQTRKKLERHSFHGFLTCFGSHFMVIASSFVDLGSKLYFTL